MYKRFLREQGGPFGNIKAIVSATSTAVEGFTLPAIGDTDGNRGVLDHEGNWFFGPAEYLRVHGARPVQNLLSFSEDFSQSAWVKSNVTPSDNGDGSFTLTMDSTGTGRDVSETLSGLVATGDTGQSFIFSVEIRNLTNREGDTDDVQLRIDELDGGVFQAGTGASIGSSITSEWQRFVVSRTFTDNSTDEVKAIIRMNSGTSVQSIEVRRAQLEESTGRADTTTPSEYVSTGVGTGSEQNTIANATSETNETDATTGWTAQNSALVTSVADADGSSEYSLRMNADGNNGACASLDLSTLSAVTGGTYLLTVRYKKISGNNSKIYLSSTATGQDTAIVSDFNNTSYAEAKYVMQYGSDVRYLNLLENGGSNNAISQISILSLKPIDLGANADGVKYFETENGNSVASNVVTEGTGAALTTVKGYMAEGQAVNLLATDTARDFTNAAWTKTNLTAALDAVGITGAPNSASTLTATAANGTAFQAVTSTSGDHHGTYWVKRKTGTGTVEITVDGGSTYTDITSLINSSTFSFVKSNQTLANPSIGFRVVTDTDEIIVDYAGSYKTTWSYSPVEGAVTRLADVEATIPAAYFSDGIGSIEFELTPLFVGDYGSQGILTANSSAATLFAYFRTGSDQAIALNDGSSLGQIAPSWSTIGQTITVKAVWNSSTSNMDFSVDATPEGGITYDGSYNPSGDLTLFKSLTQGACISDIRFYSQDNGASFLTS